jgi:acyl dehydratase
MDVDCELHARGGVGPVKTRRLVLTDDAIRAYSRRGNYHSDPDEAKTLGLPGLVAQGVQVAGPAYGVLLDEWGTDFLAHGRFECRFVGMVTEDQCVEAKVILDGVSARFEVTNETAGNVAVVGTASVPEK